MQIQSVRIFSRNNAVTFVFDLFALVFVYFIPAISHLVSLPIYLVEPMRIMLILALVHTHKYNAYLVALTLPLFSFFISMHPVFYKSMVMGIELVLNAWLFYFILKKTGKIFPAIGLSIVLSKFIYYMLKFVLIRFALIQSELISTPLSVQAIVLIILSLYVFVFYRKTRRSTKLKD